MSDSTKLLDELPIVRFKTPSADEIEVEPCETEAKARRVPAETREFLRKTTLLVWVRFKAISVTQEGVFAGICLPNFSSSR